VWNIPVACDRSTADFIVSSPLFEGTYTRLVNDYSSYKKRSMGGFEHLIVAPGSDGLEMLSEFSKRDKV
jgi:hypothetical protein